MSWITLEDNRAAGIMVRRWVVEVAIPVMVRRWVVEMAIPVIMIWRSTDGVKNPGPRSQRACPHSSRAQPGAKNSSPADRLKNSGRQGIKSSERQGIKSSERGGETR
jgi:hypothetical protein